ncbi:DUF6600 domain-containing protein [Dyella silvae]|uniref:DUF6600 domain-containing protein n=1 Tax=Dyella silvae TaxID=2994424 RepID=UPI0022647731|nr:DUF6600 domain-containing protein [Dyella silvae]
MRVLSASLLSPRVRRWMAAALFICATGITQAQTQPPPDDSGAGDPPSRAARLSYRTGDVGLLPAGEKNWGDASLNRPLTTGDRLSTGDGARAELEIGGGTLRIADDSDFGFLTLNDQMAQVEVTKGTLNLSVRGLAEGQSYEIDTPNVALVVDQPGTYRVDISDDGKSTRVIDINGRATVYGEGGAQRQLAAGRSYEFPDSSLNNVTVSDTDGGDDFDAWCNSRDQRYERPVSRQYVSDEVVGYQDLDQYGSWQSDPDYGQVWYPANVAVDWAPYRNGHWAYVGPWGWTWVDDSPWGFAPYHYGRWAHVRDRWCWVPGPVAVRPVYAPALVAFVGGAGFNVSVGIGRGPVGWFPLGPREVYNPWYRASRNYYTNVNVTNIYVHNDRNVVINNINNQYNYFRAGRPVPNERWANREVPHAFTAMSGQDFAAARNAQRHMVSVDPQRFAAAPVMPRGIDMQPSRTSFAPPRAASARALPAGGFQREVVARTAPAAAFANRNPNPAGMPRAAQAQAPANVRMLNGSGPAMRTASPERQAGAPAMQQAPSMRNGAPAEAQRPYVRSENQQPAMRPGELPSARFARPYAEPQQRPAPNNNQPRPGVSYIPNAESDRARGQQQGALPNVPRFEPAQPQQAPRQAANQDNEERFQRDNAMQRQAAQQQEMQQRQAQEQQMQQRQVQQQQMQQRQEMQQREESQRQAMQQQQAQQQRQEMQQRQAMQQQEMQQRQAQQQEMQQRQAQQQRGYEPPRGYQPPQPQPQQHPQQSGHDDHKAPPPQKNEQHN